MTDPTPESGRELDAADKPTCAECGEPVSFHEDWVGSGLKYFHADCWRVWVPEVSRAPHSTERGRDGR